MDQGVQVEEVDDNGFTVLHRLLWSLKHPISPDKFKIIKLLLNKHNTNKGCSDGLTYLMLAARAGDLNLSKLIIEKGCNVNATSKDGDTALHYAIPRCNANNVSPVQQDIEYKICELLLKNNADVTIINTSGETSLIKAVYNSNYKLCELLVSKGVDLDVTCTTVGRQCTALQYAVKDNNIPIFELLIKSGADVTKCDEKGDDILQYACLKRRIEVFTCITKLYSYPEERLVEAYKLIGSSFILNAGICYGASGISRDYIQKRIHTGLRLWRTAVEIEHNCNLVWNDKSDTLSKLAFKNVVQFKSNKDLEDMESDLDTLYIQALLIYHRILVSKTHHDQHVIFAVKHPFKKFSNADIERMKLLMEIKMLHYGLDNEVENCVYIIEEIKDYFLGILDEYHGGDFDKINFITTDIIDVMEFIIQAVEKALYACKSYAEEVRSLTQLNCNSVMLKLPYFLYMFFATTSTTEDIETLKMLTFRINHIVVSHLNNLDQDQPLHIACKEQINHEPNDYNNLGKIFPNAQVVELLLECGADVNAVDKNHQSPLHIVASNASLYNEVVSILIEHGGHIDQCNKEGEMVYKVLEHKLYKVNSFKLISLLCLAARKIMKHQEYIDEVPAHLKKFVQMH